MLVASPKQSSHRGGYTGFDAVAGNGTACGKYIGEPHQFDPFLQVAGAVESRVPAPRCPVSTIAARRMEEAIRKMSLPIK